MQLCPECHALSECKAVQLPLDKMRKMIFLTRMIKEKSDLLPIMGMLHGETLKRYGLDDDTLLKHIAPLTKRCRYSH